MRKIRRPSSPPDKITITFYLQGNDSERLSAYMWLKAQEKTTLASVMQALFQCETHGQKESDLIDLFEGLLREGDMPWVKEQEYDD